MASPHNPQKLKVHVSNGHEAGPLISPSPRRKDVAPHLPCCLQVQQACCHSEQSWHRRLVDGGTVAAVCQCGMFRGYRSYCKESSDCFRVWFAPSRRVGHQCGRSEDEAMRKCRAVVCVGLQRVPTFCVRGGHGGTVCCARTDDGVVLESMPSQCPIWAVVVC